MRFDSEEELSNLKMKMRRMWPFDGKYKKVCLSTAVLLHSLTALPGIKCLFLDSTGDGYYHQFCECLALCTLANLCFFRLKFSKQNEIFYFIHNDCRRSKDRNPEAKGIMRSFRILSGDLIIVMMFLHILAFVIVASFPWIWLRIKGGPPILIVDIWYSFSIKDSLSYGIILMIQYAQGVCATLFSCSLMSFFINVTCHGCGQLKILCRKIEQFPGNIKHTIVVRKNAAENTDSNCLCIKCIVRIHLEVIRFFKLTNEWFEIFAIISMISAIALYGKGTLSVIQQWHVESITMRIFYIAFLLLPLSSLYLYNWLGDMVSEESKNISKILDHVKWQQLSRSDIKSLSIIKSYSCNRPIELTIGSYVVLSRSFFMQICVWILTYLAYCIKLGMREKVS